MSRKKEPSKMVSVPDYWLARFQAVVEELAKVEVLCQDMEGEMDDMVDCIMTQGKMMEEAGLQPLTPEIFINMVKCLDAKERELAKREEAFKNQFGGEFPRDKKDWN